MRLSANGCGMDDTELNRIRDHVQLHAAKPRRRNAEGYGLERAYIRFAAWAIPLLIRHGEIIVDMENDGPSSGGAA